MIDECLEIFLEEQNKEESGDLILQEFRLDYGNYYFVNLNTGRVIESLLVEKDTSDKEERRSTIIERQFKVRDYLSRLLEMNKPIDGSKQIHSNNYLSFFIKKDKIKDLNKIKEKLIKSINGYYEVLIDYSNKYDKKKLELLNRLEIEDSLNREEEIYKTRSWILENLERFSDLENYKDDKNYLKIFFVSSDEEIDENSDLNAESIKKYRQESQKYIVPNLYNKNDYNVLKEGVVYGVANDNYGLNSKKPFLFNKTKKTKVSNLVSLERAKQQRSFFQWLNALSDNKKYNVYIGRIISNGDVQNYISGFPGKEFLREPYFNGYYLRVAKEKNEAEIVDFDIINGLHSKEEGMYIKNYLRLEDNLKRDYYNSNLIKLPVAMEIIDSALFANRLRNSFFADEKDISKDDPDLRSAILDTKDIFVDWYVKGKGLTALKEIRKSTYELLLRHLKKNQYSSLANAYNVRKALLLYIEEIEKGESGVMENKREISKELEIRKKLAELIENEKDQQLQNEELFGFALGQSLYYLLSLSEAADKNHSLILPILQTKKLKRMKELTNNIYQKYSYAIGMNNRRFNKLISMIMSYEGSEKVDQQEMIIAGFTSSNIIYEKKKSNENNA